jgi:tRNA A-37 threonylcarbamoyl transferase component Bud32
MTRADHPRVRALFLAALDLPPKERLEFVTSHEGDSPEVKAAVHELLRYHREETIFPARSSLEMSGQTGSWLGWLDLLIGGPGRRALAGGLAVLLLAALAWITHHQMENSLRQLAFQNLLGTLQSNARGLQNLLEEWRNDTRLIIRSAPVRGSVLEFLRNPGTKSHQSMMRNVLYTLGDLAHADFFVLDTSGRVLANGHDWNLAPAQISVELMPYLRESLRGEGILRFRGAARLFEDESPVPGVIPEALIWVPVPGEGANFAGVLMRRQSLTPQFAQSSQAHLGATGELLFIARDGLVLSPSRYLEDLLRLRIVDPVAPGLLPELRLRDPGSLVTKPLEPSAAANWPPTLAALRIQEGWDSAEARQAQTSVTEYRDYRGVPQVGSWTWLPEFQVALLAKQDWAEVHGPVAQVDRTFFALMAVVGLITLWSLVSSEMVARLQRRLLLRVHLGSYAIEKKIAEGGAGEIYLARHAALRRPAAIKLLRQDRLTAAAQQRFATEVRIASQLRNPHTVEIYDYGEAGDGTLYCAMEYLPGVTLAEWVRQAGQLPPARVVYLAVQIAGALEEAHQAGIVHLDVKPGNIMLSDLGGEYDFAKLLDFGLGLVVAADSPTPLGGTPWFVAPERLMPGYQPHPSADVYSFGVVLYFLLAGKLPYPPGTHWAAVKPENLVPLDAEVPPRLAELVAACLHPDPESRPAFGARIRPELESWDELPSWTQEQARAEWARFQRRQPAV